MRPRRAPRPRARRPRPTSRRAPRCRRRARRAARRRGPRLESTRRQSQRRALAARLDRDREAADRLADEVERGGRAHLLERVGGERDPRRRGDALLGEEVLGDRLVPRQRARHHAGPGVGDAEELQQLLDGAVLAVLAVQRDVGGVGALASERRDQVGGHVERQHVVARGRRARRRPGGRWRARPRARASARPSGPRSSLSCRPFFSRPAAPPRR